MSPHSSRVDRLLRAVIRDARSLDPRRLQSVVSQAARIQSPSATPEIEKNSLDLLSGWLETDLARLCASSTKVARCLPWMWHWNNEDSHSTVIVGQLDLAFFQEDVGWTLLSLAHPDANELLEKVRLVLGARAIDLEPIRQLVLIYLDRPKSHLVVDRNELQINQDLLASIFSNSDVH